MNEPLSLIKALEISSANPRRKFQPLKSRRVRRKEERDRQKASKASKK